MKTDIHYIPSSQREIHEELVNWAMTVSDGGQSRVSPMFQQYRSHAWQWHEPEYRPTCDTLRGWDTNEKVKKLPESHRKVIKFYYIDRQDPRRFCRLNGCSLSELAELIISARYRFDAISCKSCIED